MNTRIGSEVVYYYWYADSREQVIELFNQFNDIIQYVGSSQADHYIFEETKREYR